MPWTRFYFPALRNDQEDGKDNHLFKHFDVTEPEEETKERPLSGLLKAPEWIFQDFLSFYYTHTPEQLPHKSPYAEQNGGTPAKEKGFGREVKHKTGLLNAGQNLWDELASTHVGMEKQDLAFWCERISKLRPRSSLDHEPLMKLLGGIIRFLMGEMETCTEQARQEFKRMEDYLRKLMKTQRDQIEEKFKKELHDMHRSHVVAVGCLKLRQFTQKTRDDKEYAKVLVVVEEERARLHAREAELQEKDKQYKQLQAKLDAVSHKYGQMEERLFIAENDLADMKRKNENLAKEIDHMRREYEQLAHEKAQVLDQVESLKNELRGMDMVINNLSNEKQHLEEKIDDMKSEFQQLERERNRIEMEKERAELQLQESKWQMELLEKEIKDLKADVDSLEKRNEELAGRVMAREQ
eukprot:gene9089-10767_t